MRPHKEVAILLRIRADLDMPLADLIEYVRRCLKNGGIDLSLISIDHAVPLTSDKNDPASPDKQGTKKNIDNDPALRDDPTATTQSHTSS